MPKGIKKIRHLVAGSSKRHYNADHLDAQSHAPYSDFDLEQFETAWSTTLAGTVIDKKMDFVFGGGIKPTFQLIDEEGKDEKQIQVELEAFDDLKAKIITYEKMSKINFKATVFEAAVRAKVFGRSVVAFEPEGTAQPPQALKLIHPRELGEPIINEEDWSINGVKMGSGSTETIKNLDMIYFINRPNNPIKNNIGYGFSDIQRVLGSSKALRRILEFDAPEIAESMWANYGMFLVDTEGLTDSQAQTKIDTLLTSLKAGAFNAVSGKKDEIQWMPVELKAHVNDIVALADMYERTIDGAFGVPSALLGREEDANMATLFGKIRLFLAGPVRADREWLSDILANQWYKRLVEWFQPEALDTIRVNVEFEPLVIEDWSDQIDAIQKLKATLPNLPDKAILQLAGLEEFNDDLEENAEKNEAKQEKQETFFREAKTYIAKLNKNERATN